MSRLAGGRPSAAAPRALASGSRRCAAQFLDQGLQIRRAGAGTPAQLGPDSAGKRGVVFGPQPVLPGAGDRRPRPGCPGSGRPRPSARRRGRLRLVPRVGYRPRRPARHRRAARPGFRSARRPRQPVRHKLRRAWSGTRRGRCWPARAGASALRTVSPARLGRDPWAWSRRAGRAVPARRSIRGGGLARRARAFDPGGLRARRAGRGRGLPPAFAMPRLADRVGPARRPGRGAPTTGPRHDPVR